MTRRKAAPARVVRPRPAVLDLPTELIERATGGLGGADVVAFARASRASHAAVSGRLATEKSDRRKAWKTVVADLASVNLPEAAVVLPGQSVGPLVVTRQEDYYTALWGVVSIHSKPFGIEARLSRDPAGYDGEASFVVTDAGGRTVLAIRISDGEIREIRCVKANLDTMDSVAMQFGVRAELIDFSRDLF